MPSLAEGAASLSVHPVYRYRALVLEYTRAAVPRSPCLVLPLVLVPLHLPRNWGACVREGGKGKRILQYNSATKGSSTTCPDKRKDSSLLISIREGV